ETSPRSTSTPPIRRSPTAIWPRRLPELPASFPKHDKIRLSKAISSHDWTNRPARASIPHPGGYGYMTSETAPDTATRTWPSGHAARLAVRAGEHRGPTSGIAPGFVQGNLAILPRALADDFFRFCQYNPKPCPLLAASEPGDPRLPTLGEDVDIRTDIPRYRLWQHGKLQAEVSDLRSEEHTSELQSRENL